MIAKITFYNLTRSPFPMFLLMIVFRGKRRLFFRLGPSLSLTATVALAHVWSLDAEALQNVPSLALAFAVFPI